MFITLTIPQRQPLVPPYVQTELSILYSPNGFTVWDVFDDVSMRGGRSWTKFVLPNIAASILSFQPIAKNSPISGPGFI